MILEGSIDRLAAFDELLKAASGLTPCPHGGGRECRKRGGDGAKWHHAHYDHPKDKEAPRQPVDESQLELPGVEKEKDPEPPKQPKKHKTLGKQLSEAGILVESDTSEHIHYNEDEEGYRHKDPKELAEEGALDEHIHELLDVKDVDDLLDMFQTEVEGYSTKIDSIASSYYDESNDVETPTVTVKGRFLDKEGSHVGVFDRKFYMDPYDDVPSVYHALFKLDKEHQKGGIGKSFIKGAVEGYVKAGINKITVSPAWEGRYVWAKMGFDWGDMGAEYIEDAFPQWLERNYGTAGLDIDVGSELAEESASTPWEFANLRIPGSYDQEEDPLDLDYHPKLTVEDGDKVGKMFLLSEHGNDVWENEKGFIHLWDGDPAFEHMRKYLKLFEGEEPKEKPERQEEPEREKPLPKAPKPPTGEGYVF